MADIRSRAIDGSVTLHLTVEDRKVLTTLLGSVVNINPDHTHDTEAMSRLDRIYQMVRTEAPVEPIEPTPYSWIKTEWGGKGKLGKDNKPLESP